MPRDVPEPKSAEELVRAMFRDADRKLKEKMSESKPQK